MKKIVSILLSALIVLMCGMICASAADSAEVYVTITDAEGKIAVAAEKLTVTDADADGALTITDALYAAHEKFYTGGAAAGYATEVTQYGLGLQMLWGSANGGSYGYYVNNASAWALTDPVTDGDYVAAYVYTDLVGWSDNYSYFDRFMGDVTANDAITLTYSQAGYDESWNPVTLPVEGAVITVDGKATDFITDAEGKVTLTLTENGAHLVSATIEGKNLVAPVFIASVTGAVEEPENPNAPATGEDPALFTVALCVMMLAFAAVMIIRKKYAK